MRLLNSISKLKFDRKLCSIHFWSTTEHKCRKAQSVIKVGSIYCSPLSGASVYINGYLVGSQSCPTVSAATPGTSTGNTCQPLCMGQCGVTFNTTTSTSTTTTTTSTTTTSAGNPFTPAPTALVQPRSVNVSMSNTLVAATGVNALTTNNLLGTLGKVLFCFVRRTRINTSCVTFHWPPSIVGVLWPRALINTL